MQVSLLYDVILRRSLLLITRKHLILSFLMVPTLSIIPLRALRMARPPVNLMSVPRVPQTPGVTVCLLVESNAPWSSPVKLLLLWMTGYLITRILSPTHPMSRPTIVTRR